MADETSRGLLPSSQPAGAVARISELGAHGAEADFVELANPDRATSIDLSGWTLEGAAEATLPGGTVLAAGARLVVPRSPASVAARSQGVVVSGQLDRVLVRFARRTYLVLGADAPSAELLATLPASARGTTRALVTPDPSAPWLGRVRAAGWRVVTGDPEDVAFLRTLLRRRRGQRHVLRGLAVLSPDSTAAQTRSLLLMASFSSAVRSPALPMQVVQP